MIPAVDGGLAATTTTSRLRAAVAERVMATVAGSGVAGTTATSRLRAVAAEREMALAFDGGVAATAAGNSCRLAVIRLQRIYNFLLFHAIILSLLDV